MRASRRPRPRDKSHHRYLAGKRAYKGNAVMPSCGASDQAAVREAIESMRGDDRAQCEALAEALGLKVLCQVLHATRRWYTYNTGNAAWKVLPHVSALSEAMDLSPPVGAYRGFKVDASSPLARLRVGDVVTIPVTRNGGCSSWTLGRHLADRFSGSPKGKVGLVVQLTSGEGVQPFIAPPEHCAPWFNKLYAQTMGTSHRHKEQEYAIHAPKIRVRVVAVKGKPKSTLRRGVTRWKHPQRNRSRSRKRRRSRISTMR